MSLIKYVWEANNINNYPVLLLTFYIVIRLGAGKKKDMRAQKVLQDIFGIRILILILAIVGIILWFFL